MDALSPPTKRARRGTRGAQATEDASGLDVPERRTRGSGKPASATAKKSASKKGKSGAKKGGKGSGRVISASDWVDHDSAALVADGEFPSRSASDVDFDDAVSSDASEDEDFDIKYDSTTLQQLVCMHTAQRRPQLLR